MPRAVRLVLSIGMSVLAAGVLLACGLIGLRISEALTGARRHGDAGASRNACQACRISELIPAREPLAAAATGCMVSMARNGKSPYFESGVKGGRCRVCGCAYGWVRINGRKRMVAGASARGRRHLCAVVSVAHAQVASRVPSSVLINYGLLYLHHHPQSGVSPRAWAWL